MKKILASWMFLAMTIPLFAADEFKPKFNPVQEKRYRDFSNIILIMLKIKNASLRSSDDDVGKSVGEYLYEIYPSVFADLQEFIKNNPDSHFLPEVKILFAELYIRRVMFYTEDSAISSKMSQEIKNFYMACKAEMLIYLLSVIDGDYQNIYFSIPEGISSGEPAVAIALCQLAILTGDDKYFDKVKNDYPDSLSIKEATEISERIKKRRSNDK
ncbi:MAG: hypothetical protein Q8Q06_01720 [bacterium]|nr:hypothetical protein [bacterium]